MASGAKKENETWRSKLAVGVVCALIGVFGTLAVQQISDSSADDRQEEAFAHEREIRVSEQQVAAVKAYSTSMERVENLLALIGRNSAEETEAAELRPELLSSVGDLLGAQGDLATMCDRQLWGEAVEITEIAMGLDPLDMTIQEANDARLEIQAKVKVLRVELGRNLKAGTC
jgi:hypothetical protein